MEDILLACNAVRRYGGDNDRMAGIGTSLISGDDVNVFAEVVYDLSLAFIPPLSANDDLNGHTMSFVKILSERTSSEESGGNLRVTDWTI